MSNKIACSHPGKIGDALYCLPTIRYLCEQKNCQADFYTSSYCSSLRDLFEYQTYIDNFIVLDGWQPDNFNCGGQPWQMPISSAGYKTLYQLGFRSVPDTRLDHFIARQIGLNPGELPSIQYDFPVWDFPGKFFPNLPKKYYVLAPRGETTFKETFTRLINISDIPILQVGSRGDLLWENLISLGFDFTGVGFLETLYLLSKSSGFVGLMSSNLVLANGFPNINKVAPHDGQSWDMRHVVYSPTNHYPVNPTAEQILELLRSNNA